MDVVAPRRSFPSFPIVSSAGAGGARPGDQTHAHFVRAKVCISPGFLDKAG